MADVTSPNPIEQRLILVLEEHLNGALKAAGELSAVAKSADKATGSIKDYSKASQTASSSSRKFDKDLMHATASASILTSALRKTTVAFTLLSAGLSKAWNNIVNSNRALLEYSITSTKTYGSVSRLRKVVDESRKGFENSAFSYRDAAEALAEFRSSSLEASTALDFIPGLEQQIADMYQKLSQKFGDAKAKEVWGKIVSGIGNRPRELQKVLSIMEAGGDHMRERLLSLGRSIDPSNSGLQTSLRDMANMMDNVGADDAATRGIKTWDTFWSKLNTLVENFSTNVLTNLSDKLFPIFDQLEGYFPAIQKGLSDALGWVSSNMPSIVESFQGAISVVADLVKSFMGLGTIGKTVAGLLAGSVLLPGFGPTIVSAIGHTISFGTHLTALTAPKILSSFASLSQSVLGIGGSFTKATTGVKLFSTAALGPLAVAATAAGAAIHQLYTWIEKGPEFTWGGKITEWLFDIEEKMDRVNNKGASFELGFTGGFLGTKESGPEKQLREIYEQKKKLGKLAPDEQSFDQFALKRQQKLDNAANNSAKKQQQRIEQQKRDQEKLAEAAAKAVGGGVPSTEPVKPTSDGGIEDFRARVAAANGDVSTIISLTNAYFNSIKVATDAAASSADSLGKIMETSGFGPMNEMGKASHDLADNITRIMKDMKEVAEREREAAIAALAYTSNIEERDRLIGQIAEAEKKMAEAGQLAVVRNQALNQEYEKRGNLQKLTTDSLKADLQIAQATLGAAGLSVKAQMNVVDSLQQQKELLKKQHSLMLDAMRAGDNSIATITKEKELRNEIKNITSEQVNQLKELRDGYLDAVTAQAFGAGKFEKIIVSQEKNLRVALDNGMAKANVLLGTVGEAAKLSDVPIARFSAGGYGLEKTDGSMMGDDDIKSWQKELMTNMTDDVSKAAAEAATRITFESVDHIDASLATVDKSIDMFDDVVKRAIQAMSRFGATQGGNASGNVLFGEAFRTGRIPSGATPGPDLRGEVNYPPPQVSNLPPGFEAMPEDMRKTYLTQLQNQENMERRRSEQQRALVQHIESLKESQGPGLSSGFYNVPQLSAVSVKPIDLPEIGDSVVLKSLESELNISTNDINNVLTDLRKSTEQGQRSAIEQLKALGVQDEGLQYELIRSFHEMLVEGGQVSRNAFIISPDKLFEGRVKFDDAGFAQTTDQSKQSLENMAKFQEQVGSMWESGLGSIASDLKATMRDLSATDINTLFGIWNKGVDDTTKATLENKSKAKEAMESMIQRNRKATDVVSTNIQSALINALPTEISDIQKAGIKLGSINIDPHMFVPLENLDPKNLELATKKIIEAEKASSEGALYAAKQHLEAAKIYLGTDVKDETAVDAFTDQVYEQVSEIHKASKMLNNVNMGKDFINKTGDILTGAWDSVSNFVQKNIKFDVKTPANIPQPANVSNVQKSISTQPQPTMSLPVNPVQQQPRDLVSTIDAIPVSPQISPSESSDAKTRPSTGSVRVGTRKGSPITGGASGKAVRLCKEACVRLMELASLVDDLDDDEIGTLDRPGSSGQRAIPGA